MTISITQQHPTAKELITLQSVSDMFMRGSRVRLPAVLEYLAAHDYDVSVHQTFDFSAERHPTVTYRVSRSKLEAKDSITVQHIQYSASLHSLRCTVEHNALTYATHTFKDVDGARNHAASIDSLLLKAMRHDIVNATFLNDAISYDFKDADKQQDAPLPDAVCLN